MIQANECRIGNWVEWKGKYGIVKAIHNNINRKELDVENLEIPKGSFSVCLPLKEFTPIPITPDILEKAGFDGNILLLGKKEVCSLGWHLCANVNIVNLAYDYDDCAYHSHNAEYNYDIKYLHQLQNLYFSLTGKELEINL